LVDRFELIGRAALATLHYGNGPEIRPEAADGGAGRGEDGGALAGGAMDGLHCAHEERAAAARHEKGQHLKSAMFRWMEGVKKAGRRLRAEPFAQLDHALGDDPLSAIAGSVSFLRLDQFDPGDHEHAIGAPLSGNSHGVTLS
jgi:hypothetical protein